MTIPAATRRPQFRGLGLGCWAPGLGLCRALAGGSYSYRCRERARQRTTTCARQGADIRARFLDYSALFGTFWIYGSSAIRTKTLRTGELLMVLPRLAEGPKAFPSSYRDFAEDLPYKNLFPGATAGSVLS